MRATKSVVRSVLVIAALVLAAGACGKSSPAPGQEGGEQKKSKFKITGVVSMLTDFLVPSAHAAEASPWDEPAATAAQSQAEPGPCPNEFEPSDDGLYAYLYRITEDTLDPEAVDPATLKPVCVTRVDQATGAYEFDFRDEDPKLEAAYIVVKPSSGSAETTHELNVALAKEVKGMIYEDSRRVSDQTLSTSTLGLKSPFYLFSGATTSDTKYLAAVEPMKVQLAVAKMLTPEIRLVEEALPKELGVEATPASPLSSTDFLREAFFSATTDDEISGKDVKLDIDPVSTFKIGTKTVAYRMGGISPKLANDLRTTPAELATSLLQNATVADAVTSALRNGEIKLSELVGAGPNMFIRILSQVPTTAEALATIRSNVMSNPVGAAMAIARAKGVDTKASLAKYAYDFMMSADHASTETPSRVALTVQALGKIHELASKNDLQEVLKNAESSLVLAARKITERLNRHETAAIQKIRLENGEEALPTGKEGESIEEIGEELVMIAPQIDTRQILGKMDTSALAEIKRFRTLFQDHLNPERLSFQSKESTARLVSVSEEIFPMFEEAATLFDSQESEALEKIEGIALKAPDAFKSEDPKTLEELYSAALGVQALAPVFSLLTRTTVTKAVWYIEGLRKQLRETLAARALEPAAETPKEPSIIAEGEMPLSEIDQKFLSMVRSLFEELRYAAEEKQDPKTAEYLYGQLMQLYEKFSSEGLSDPAIREFKATMEKASNLLSTA